MTHGHVLLRQCFELPLSLHTMYFHHNRTRESGVCQMLSAGVQFLHATDGRPNRNGYRVHITAMSDLVRQALEVFCPSLPLALFSNAIAMTVMPGRSSGIARASQAIVSGCARLPCAGPNESHPTNSLSTGTTTTHSTCIDKKDGRLLPADCTCDLPQEQLPLISTALACPAWRGYVSIERGPWR